MSHTTEPWTVGESCHVENGQDIRWVVQNENIICKGTLQDMVRLVACVNGCAGLNPAAYHQAVEALKEAYIALNEGALREEEGSWLMGAYRPAMDRARTALDIALGKRPA